MPPPVPTVVLSGVIADIAAKVSAILASLAGVLLLVLHLHGSAPPRAFCLAGAGPPDRRGRHVTVLNTIQRH
jgi:hypothetical protein